MADTAEVPRPGFFLGASQRDIVHVLLLVIFDVFAIYEAFIISMILRLREPASLAHQMSIEHFGELIGALTPVWIGCFALCGLYSVGSHRGRVSELGRIILAVTCSVMTLIVIDYMRVLDPIFPGRSVPLYSIPLGVAFVFVCRMLIRWIVGLANGRGYGLRRVIVIGAGPLAAAICGDLSQPRGYKILAVISPADDGAVASIGAPVMSSLELALNRFAGIVDEVIQADVDLDRHEIAGMMSAATSQGITYRFVPDQYGVYASAASMTTIAGVPVMDIRLTALDGWGAVLKRSFDLVGAFLLLVLLAPVVLVAAVAVKITDPSGPVLYRSNRLGRGGTVIPILKFRSMLWQYSTGPNRPCKTPEDAFRAMGREDLVEEFQLEQKVAEDPRVSRLGAFLRRTSVDELPQLWNVLLGGLSLIGPRPITAEELERYGPQRASFLALKPGMTGLWQVSGRSSVTYDERIKLDIHYVENWSLGLDLNIMLRTIVAVAARKGAV